MDIERFIQRLGTQGMSGRTINRKLHALNSFFHCMQSHGVVAVNPAQVVARISVEKKERGFLTHEQLAALLNQPTDPLITPPLWTLAYTGQRVSELCSLQKRDVDLDQRVIRVRGKGNRERTLPIHDDLHHILEGYTHHELRGVDAYDHFFHSHNTSTLSPSTMNRWLRNIVTHLGWSTHVTVHTLRHTFGYMYVDHGGNVVELQKLLGHESLATTSIYCHTTHTRLSEGISRFPHFGR
ncbi:integrase/recombinase XerD [Alicyclobacillus cycloheptanicus]|uniref:Integrase/recombinase XerD n=2 Tax=Alicyclobacillus cycloheptanicus TaxID=1457 RepID=A0ABT9XNG3_9BACL|nr:integrase/recombinase XerD [Alicyclobacillus cycloheptanicus]